jgi:hypothetical protein
LFQQFVRFCSNIFSGFELSPTARKVFRDEPAGFPVNMPFSGGAPMGQTPVAPLRRKGHETPVEH